MEKIVLLLILLITAPAGAQYQVDPTHLYPSYSNTAPAKKTPPKNHVVSTVDKQKAGIPMHKADRYYPINQNKPMPIRSNRSTQKVPVLQSGKKPAYRSLYQDPSTNP